MNEDDKEIGRCVVCGDVLHEGASALAMRVTSRRVRLALGLKRDEILYSHLHCHDTWQNNLWPAILAGIEGK